MARLIGVNLRLVFIFFLHITLLALSLLPNSLQSNFLHCFSSHSNLSQPISELVFTNTSASYSNKLQFSIKNLRFSNTFSPKPQFIVTPFHESHVQASIVCSKLHRLQVRVRSGGHDYEGLSYVSKIPFIVIDLINLQSIAVDVESQSVWVESGSTLGELYYKIAEKTTLYGFPGGSCPTVGIGGFVSGGGFGTLLRKYGLAADNVIDAKIVDANGQILNRESMGEDLFWAIRGGGGSSFGVILSWKLRLVPLPPIVTIFNLKKTMGQGGNQLLQKWQTIGNELHEDLFLHVLIRKDQKTVLFSFDSLFLGPIQRLLPLMQENFPELGLEATNCQEMSWIESAVFFAGFPSKTPTDVLRNRPRSSKIFFKAKSDYVKEPISEEGLEGLWKTVVEEEKRLMLILTPYGGKMSEISEGEIPFPHRKENLFQIQYIVTWGYENETEENITWMRRIYFYMESYVSKSPREAYLNHRDVDLGRNRDEGSVSYEEAKEWGVKYFKNNFDRLVQVKTLVDPSNFFKNEQSIPALY